ncbi:MAG: HTH domain-containing protein [Bacteroidetes bacterium]|nr:HTH domain-containing protein [Bacteroidota bacterium]
MDKKVIDRGIIGNIEFAVAYLKERVPVRYEIKKLRRDEFPEYPIEAYREAVVNAIIHFDYFLGDTIAIEKLKSSIIINNKGELLFPEKDFGKRSEARNRLLADLLARTDFMEKAGTGIKRVRDACKANNNNIHFNFTDAFWVTIETNVTNNVVDNVVDNRLKKIMELVTEDNQISASQMAKILNITSRTVQRDIGKLKNQNKIKRAGSEKGGHWVVTFFTTM